ncbi:MAG: hypothetical protein ABI811_24045 [Acidobacteriota bacterium]
MRFRIAKISVGRRIDLARRIRDAGRRVEFLEAGSDPRDKLEAMVLASEIDRVYLDWALEAVEGLSIDGVEATPGAVIEKGPPDLTGEILARIRSECGLNDEQRKN